MTEHKFTDEEVVRTLKCQLSSFGTYDGCSFGGDCVDCLEKVLHAALDLINRQRGEIERLKAGWDYIPAEAAQALRERAVTEAVKEFAESIKTYYDHIDKTVGALINYTIDQKLKEFLGEGGADDA